MIKKYKYLDIHGLRRETELVREYFWNEVRNKCMRCPTCGAPIVSIKCEFCGANFKINYRGEVKV